MSEGLPVTRYGRERLRDFDEAERLEWLVTNGIGGYASGTVTGGRARCYHGLLVAALSPPLGRVLTVAGLEITATYQGRDYPLSAQRWRSGEVSPRGDRLLESFRLEGRAPVWCWGLGDALLEQRILMAPRANTTCVIFSAPRASGPIDLTLKAFGTYRDFHGTTRGEGWTLRVDALDGGVRVTAFDGATPFVLMGEGATVRPAHTWYRDYALARETERGLRDTEDALHFATAHGRLLPGDQLALFASTEAAPATDAAACRRAAETAERALLARASARPESWRARLVLAADQFVVDRDLGGRRGKSVLAGYPWFGDWGRDTMISLPGLALATGRPELAADLLRTYARVVDGGMLPNRFPDSGEAPEYNTVDASLWYFEAARATHEATGDDALLAELYDPLRSILRAHAAGTRYGIRVDGADGLLRAGQPGVQLTWMDARQGDWVVTPRIGKPVEINALWLHALRVMARFSARLGRPAAEWIELAAAAAEGFERFWNPVLGCCFDVLDGPDGDDPALRPNQLLAVSLGESPLSAERQRAVVERCGRALLTSYGLRSLAPSHPDYRGVYTGDPLTRDGRYHQGTAWGWLIGPYALAHYKVFGDADAALSLIAPMAQQLDEHGLGTLAEIADGDPPFRPRGCIAQAWSVAQVLQVLQTVSAPRSRP